MNFVKNEVLKWWILCKMRFWNCEFGKNEILKLWILSKMIVSKCEFWINSGFLPQYRWYWCFLGSLRHSFIFQWMSWRVYICVWMGVTSSNPRFALLSPVCLTYWSKWLLDAVTSWKLRRGVVPMDNCAAANTTTCCCYPKSGHTVVLICSRRS